MAAIIISLCRPHQTGQKSGTHGRHFARNRIGKFKLIATAAKKPGLVAGNKRPCHRFDHAPTGKNAAGTACSDLAGGQNGTGKAVNAWQGFRLNPVNAGDPDHLFHQVGTAINIWPPGGGRHFDLLALAVNYEAKIFECFLDPGCLELQPCQPRHLVAIKFNGVMRVGNGACCFGFRRRAAADLQYKVGGIIKSRLNRLWINAALKAETGVGLDIGLASGPRRSDGIEIGRFDQHARGLIGRSAGFSAHYTAETEHAAFVCNDSHLGIDLIAIAVEPLELFRLLALFAEAGANRAV